MWLGLEGFYPENDWFSRCSTPHRIVTIDEFSNSTRFWTQGSDQHVLRLWIIFPRRICEPAWGCWISTLCLFANKGFFSSRRKHVSIDLRQRSGVGSTLGEKNRVNLLFVFYSIGPLRLMVWDVSPDSKVWVRFQILNGVEEVSGLALSYKVEVNTFKLRDTNWIVSDVMIIRSGSIRGMQTLDLDCMAFCLSLRPSL